MPLKSIAFAIAFALPVAAAVSAAVPTPAQSITARPAPVHALIALEAPLSPSDVMFGHSLHVAETGRFARDGHLYLAVTAPTESALEAFLQGIGQQDAAATALPRRWTGSTFEDLPASAVAGHAALNR